jgi:hypothetical protein
MRFDRQAVSESNRVGIDLCLKAVNLGDQIGFLVITGVIGDVLSEPVPQMLHGHEIRTIRWQLHESNIQGLSRLLDKLGPMIGSPIPHQFDGNIGKLHPQPFEHLNGVLLGKRLFHPPHETFEGPSGEGDLSALLRGRCRHSQRLPNGLVYPTLDLIRQRGG